MHRLHVFGRIDLRDGSGDETHAVLAQSKRLALLAYLCLNSSSHACRRDDVIATFWPELDDEHARKALNKAIHFLRHELGEDIVVSRNIEDLLVEPTQLSCDAIEFEQLLRTDKRSQALELYAGDLLPAFHIEAGAAFDQWLEAERARLRGLAAAAARQEAEEHERARAYTKAVTFARRALELSDTNERVLRQLLELLDRLGDRAGAIYAYEKVARRLRSELDVDPSPETQKLVERIRSRVGSDERVVSDVEARPPGGPASEPSKQSTHVPDSDKWVSQALSKIGYETLRVIGRGGMATVYLARDNKHSRDVAIKVLSPELSALRGSERFNAEIRITANLQHPNILPLFESGEVNGLLFYVMPFVEGESLRARLDREKSMRSDEAIALLRTLAGALDYAHDKGVVHRDIKPENILLQAGQPLLADFGIARALSNSGVDRITVTGMSLGTPQYMSPEQAAGDVNVGPASDIYSLGAVAYEMFTGEAPFSGPNTQAVLAKVILEPPRPLKKLKSSVPATVETAVLRSLAKHAEDRFRRAGEFAEALVRGTSLLSTAQGRRRIAFSAALAASVLAIAASTATGLFSFGRSEPTPQNPKWILLADFESPADDPGLGRSVRELIGSTLQQSKVLATVPEDQITAARTGALIPDSARLTLDHARHIASRTAVAAIVDGSVGRVGRLYSLVVRGIDPGTGRVLATVNGAASEEKIIPTAQRLARELGRDLGARSDESGRALVSYRAATPSLEAYRLFVEAQRLAEVDENDPGALRTLRRAVAVDSGFATAWALLAETYRQLGPVDSIVSAYRQAKRHADRLSPAELWALEATYARYRDDARLALRYYDRALEANPSWIFGQVLRARALRVLGQWDEAVEAFRHVLRSSPLGPPQAFTMEMIEALAPLGYLEEARQLREKLSGRYKRDAELWIAFGEADWKRIEQLQLPLARTQARAAWSAASSLAAQGRWREAQKTMFAGSAGAQNQAAQYSLNDFLGAAGLKPVWRTQWQRVTRLGRDEHFFRGRGFVWLDQLDSARIELAWLRADLKRDSIPREAEWSVGADFIEASIAEKEGRWRDVVRVLGNSTLVGLDVQLMPQRFAVANAYEKLNRPDSAFVYYDLIVRTARADITQQFERGWVYPFALRRLAIVSERLNNPDQARGYWLRFIDLFQNADPEFQPMVAEARAASKS